MAATAGTFTPGTQYSPAGSVNEGGSDYLVMFHPVVFRFSHRTVSATGDTIAITTPWKCRVISVWLDQLANDATSASTVTVRNGATNVIATCAFSATDDTVTVASSIDDTYAVVESGTALTSYWTENSAELNTGDLYVMVMPMIL